MRNPSGVARRRASHMGWFARLVASPTQPEGEGGQIYYHLFLKFEVKNRHESAEEAKV